MTLAPDLRQEVSRLRRGNPRGRHQATTPPLPPAGSGDNYGGMTPGEIDAKIGLSEAKADIKFGELLAEVRSSHASVLAEMRVTNTRLDHIERITSGMKANIWFAAFTAVGLAIGAMAYGGQLFGLGLDSGDLIRSTVAETVRSMTPPPAGMQTPPK